MIPTDRQIHALWDKYNLPDQKRIHVRLVAAVALFLADGICRNDKEISIDTDLLNASALLHDIDKAVPKRSGERHPDTGVRILREEHMDEVADVVSTHPLHSILDPDIAPKTWEEKCLYLSDKMVKLDIIGVDKRFALWNAEHLPRGAQAELDAAYPKVKMLESTLLTLAHITPADIAKLA